MSETNLNDIFADVPTETPFEGNDGFEIDVCNSANDARKKYKVYPENTLAEVLDLCKDPKNGLGIAPSCNDVVFEFNGKTTSDSSVTVTDFGLVGGGKLLLNPNAKVA